MTEQMHTPTDALVKPIANIELRAPQEVFDIMVGRIRSALIAPAASSQERIAQLVAWARDDLAIGLAGLDGVTLRQINATVGDPQDATNWREYLGRADDLLAHLSLAASAAALGAQPLAPEPLVLGPFTLVPEAALKWLNGEGPDHEGYWFGDFPDDQPPKGAFSWRRRFAAMLAAAPERIVGAAK